MIGKTIDSDKETPFSTKGPVICQLQTYEKSVNTSLQDLSGSKLHEKLRLEVIFGCQPCRYEKKNNNKKQTSQVVLALYAHVPACLHFEYKSNSCEQTVIFVFQNILFCV